MGDVTHRPQRERAILTMREPFPGAVGSEHGLAWVLWNEMSSKRFTTHSTLELGTEAGGPHAHTALSSLDEMHYTTLL